METKQKNKSVTIYVPINLYEFFVEQSNEFGKIDKRIIKMSEIMLRSMEAGKHTWHEEKTNKLKNKNGK